MCSCLLMIHHRSFMRYKFKLYPHVQPVNSLLGTRRLLFYIIRSNLMASPRPVSWNQPWVSQAGDRSSWFSLSWGPQWMSQREVFVPAHLCEDKRDKLSSSEELLEASLYHYQSGGGLFAADLLSCPTLHRQCRHFFLWKGWEDAQPLGQLSLVWFSFTQFVLWQLRRLRDSSLHFSPDLPRMTWTCSASEPGPACVGKNCWTNSTRLGRHWRAAIFKWKKSEKT